MIRNLIAMLILSGLPLAALADLGEVEVRRDIVYHRVGERELLLDAYLPKVEEARPAVLVVHGGGWRTGDRRQLQAYARGLAERGYVGFAIDYRLAPEHKFPAQIEDCRSAVKWVREHAEEYGADPGKIGAVGYSAGGHLALLLGTTGEADAEADTRLQAVVAGGAPGDFEWFPDNGKWAEFLMGGDLDTAAENFHNASPSVFADKADPPVFMFHGAADKIVPLIWSESCHKSLVEAGVRAELHVVPKADHIGTIADRTSLEKAFEFLSRELGGGMEGAEQPGGGG
ncbi:Carboxylesterase NlhH [Planctomycetes bacterium MalM25]|nr:Carboxylesterase NlhH [Planctomycetes bacterium MalM25]